MKNLFKNLMLVAVAAMAFVACSEVSVEVDNLTKKTMITGVATIDTDDTRSGFVSSETDENGTTVYKSAWDGGENIKVINGSQVITTTIDAEGRFTVELEGTPGFINLYSPAEAWVSDTFTIPTVQTPRNNSVDPAAHILRCQNAQVSNDTVNAKMQHEVGYGKMTVNTPAEFVIDHVEVELNGVWYGFDKNLKYTINADYVEGNVFWFATDVVEVSDFTVTAYDAEGNAYTKSVTIPEDRELKFQYTRVSTFSVSNLESVEKPEAPIFTRAEEKHLYDDNDRMIAFYTDNDDELVLDLCYVFAGNSILPGTYTHVYNETGYIYTGIYSYYIPNTTDETDPTYYISGGEVVVSVVNGEYFIEFKNLTDDASNIILEYASFTGMIKDYTLPDTREKLATPVVNTPTVNGNKITLTWSKVDGADGYYVYCTQDSTINTTTTELTATFTMPAYETAYGFYIKAIANDENPTYRSSDETYFQTVATGSDPDKFADYIMDSLEWNSAVYNHGGAFQMKGACLKYPAQDYVAFYLNSADHTENSIKPGEYSSYNYDDYTPESGQFAGLLSLNWGDYTRPSSFDSTCSLTVEFANDVYTVILNYKGTTYGYRGMPNGWEAPEFSGEEPGEDGGEEPGEGGGDEPDDNVLGSKNNPYTFESVAVNNFLLNFEGAENGASLQIDRQGSDLRRLIGTSLLNGDEIYAGSGNIYTLNGTVYDYASYASYSKITVTALGNAVYTINLEMSINGGTPIYYTYTGTVTGQDE